MKQDRIQDNASSQQASDLLVDQFKQNQDNSITYRQNGQSQPQNKKKILIGLVGAVVAIGIIVMLVLILSGKSGDDPGPSPGPNPDTDHTFSQFKIDNATIDNSVYGQQSFLINFDRDQLDSQRDPVAVTEINDFIDQVKVTSQGLGYDSSRLKLTDFKKQTTTTIDEDDLFLAKRYGLHETSLEDVERFYAPEVFLARGYNSQFEQGVNYEQTGIKLVSDNEGYFYLSVQNNAGHEIINTNNSRISLMEHYLLWEFSVDSANIYGVSNNGTFNMDMSQNYSMWAQQNFDDSMESNRLPFVIIQLNSGEFFGLALFSTQAKSIYLSTSTLDNNTHINFQTIGGSLDFFFFKGPTYDAVIKQYQAKFGVPKLNPIESLQVQVQSSDFIVYDTSKPIDWSATLDYVNDFDLYPELAKIPYQLLTNLENGQYSNEVMNSITSLQTDYQIQAIMPLVPFTTTTDTDCPLVKGYDKASDSWTNLSVSVADPQLKDTKVYAIDVFDQDKAKACIKSMMDDKLYYYLPGNSPLFASPSSVQSSESGDNAPDDFETLPYLPVKSLNANTLSSDSQHYWNVDGDDQGEVFHFDTHQMYGSQLSYIVQSLQQDNLLLFSDSTWFNDQVLGVMTVLPQSGDDLETAFTNLLNYNMYGIQAGVVACMTNDGVGKLDTAQCQRYMQMAVYQPVVSIAANVQSSSVDGDSITSFQEISYQRFSLLHYMRTQIFLQSIRGGSLVKPYSTHPMVPVSEKVDYHQIMFGDSLVAYVDTRTDSGSLYKTGFLLEGNYADIMELNTKDAIYEQTADGKFNFDTTLMSRNKIYQMPGTVVSHSNATQYHLTQVSQVRDEPIVLSIIGENLQDDDIKFRAFGHVYFEHEGLTDPTQGTHYTVKAKNHVISFNAEQVTPASSAKQGNDEVEKIFMNNLNFDYKACSVNLDGSISDMSIEMLNNKTNWGYIHMDNNENKIEMNNVDYIIYDVNKSMSCQDAFQKVDCSVIDASKDNQLALSLTYNYGLQNKENTFTLLVYQVDETSVFTQMFPNDIDPDTQSGIPHYLISSYYNYKPDVGGGLTDIIDYQCASGEDFYMNFKSNGASAVNADEWLFTYMSPGEQAVFDEDVVLMEHRVNTTIESNFYGLGERDGDFYLNNKTVYSLWSNSNNLPTGTARSEKTVEYGKNGFLPTIFIKSPSKNTVSAIATLSPYAQEFELDEMTDATSGDTYSKIRHTIAGPVVQQVVVVDQSPDKVFQKLQNAIQIGTLLQNTNQEVPVDFTFGHYINLNQIANLKGVDAPLTPIDVAYNFYSDVLQYPIEGVYLTVDTMDQYQSMSLSDDYLFNNDDIRVFQVMRSSENKDSTKQYVQDLIESRSVIQNGFDFDSSTPFYGQDQQGIVVYPDYANSSSIQEYLVNVFSEYTTNYVSKTSLDYYFGLQLTDNEITNLYCNGECFEGETQGTTKYDIRIGQEQLYYKQLSWDAVHSFFNSSEKEFHNMNGLLQQIAMKNQLEAREMGKSPIVSKSIFLGSGNLGGVGSLMEYYECTLDGANKAIEGLQRMSILGIHMTGVSVNCNNWDEDLDKAVNIFKTLNIYSPLSLIQYFTLPNATSMEGFETSQSFVDPEMEMRYKMMVYTRTGMHKTLKYGDMPMVRPLFYQFSDDTNAAKYTKQYMYGDNILVLPNEQSQSALSGQFYFPAASWVQVYSGGVQVDYPTRINSAGELKDCLGHRSYLREGTITPLYDSNNTAIQNAQDTLNAKLDLHVVFNAESSGPTENYALGKVLVDNRTTTDTGTTFCEIDFYYLKSLQVISVSTGTVGPYTDSDLADCGSYIGYQLGRLYIYGNKLIDTTKQVQIGSVRKNNVFSEIGEQSAFKWIEFSDFNVNHVMDLSSIQFNL